MTDIPRVPSRLPGFPNPSNGLLLATDVIPFAPSDVTTFPPSIIYFQVGGAVTLVTFDQNERTITVGDQTILPLLVSSVKATGTDNEVVCYRFVL